MIWKPSCKWYRNSNEYRCEGCSVPIGRRGLRRLRRLCGVWQHSRYGSHFGFSLCWGPPPSTHRKGSRFPRSWIWSTVESINQSSFKLTALYSPKSSFQVTGTLLRLLAAGSHEAFLTIFRCSTKAFLLTLRYKHELTPGARIGMQCKWVNSIQNPNSLSSFAVNVVFFGNMLKKKL